MEWISVKDKLPAINEKCLIVIWGHVQKAMFKGFHKTMNTYLWLADDLDNWPHEDIIYWMICPEPPTQKP